MVGRKTGPEQARRPTKSGCGDPDGAIVTGTNARKGASLESAGTGCGRLAGNMLPLCVAAPEEAEPSPNKWPARHGNRARAADAWQRNSEKAVSTKFIAVTLGNDLGISSSNRPTSVQESPDAWGSAPGACGSSAASPISAGGPPHA